MLVSDIVDLYNIITVQRFTSGGVSYSVLNSSAWAVVPFLKRKLLAPYLKFTSDFDDNCSADIQAVTE